MSRIMRGMALACALSGTLACDLLEPGTTTWQIHIVPSEGAPASTLEAIYLTVDGPTVEDLTPAQGVMGFTRRVSGSESKIVLLGPFPDGPLASFRGPATSPGAYNPTLVQASTADLALVDGDLYGVSIVR